LLLPILRVEIVEAPGWSRPEGLARRIADAVAEVLGSNPQRVWVRVSTIAPGDYAENAGAADGASPVFVSILEREPPQGGGLGAEVTALSKAVGLACGRSVNDIHIIYEPPGRGRVAFGGRLLT
jgi:phenylpyruvate tautomerase PptA (4-oxalocrotonate tautomerase family)